MEDNDYEEDEYPEDNHSIDELDVHAKLSDGYLVATAKQKQLLAQDNIQDDEEIEDYSYHDDDDPPRSSDACTLKE